VKVIARVFKSLKFLGGTMHLKPTAGGQISTLIFGFGGEPYAYPMKNYELKPEWQRTLPSFGNFSWEMNRIPPQIQISKLTFDTLLWASGALFHLGS
jgi:hypothetical protein